MTRQNEQPTPSRDEIERCAYQLYEQRGRQPGHALEDWLQAESRLSAERSKTSGRAIAEFAPKEPRLQGIPPSARPSGRSERRRNGVHA